MDKTTVIGGLVTLGLGVIIVGAIYQLGTNSANVTTAASSVATTTLNSLYK